MTPSAPAGTSGLLVDVSQPVRFTFEGREITAAAGQSVGAALYASGVRTFTRSFKYHRPRGLFCIAGDCPNCLMNVDGKPNVRTCVEPVRPGQLVRHQNAWPSLNFDVLRIFDRMDRFLPVGFYYKRFHKPRWLWPIFEHTVRHIAGLGRIDVQKVPEVKGEVEYLHTDVCVVGGGPAGLAAAVEAARAGADVILLDRQPRLGGHLLYTGNALDQVEALAAELRFHPQARVLTSCTAFGVYEGNMLGAVVHQGGRIKLDGRVLNMVDRFLKIRPRRIIVCTGAREQPFVFHNNDLPGVFLAGGVQRLGRLYGVQAGKRAVVVTDHDRGRAIAQELAALGIDVAAVVDAWPASNSPATVNGVTTRSGSVVLAAHGGSAVRGVSVARLASPGVIDDRSREEIDCDLVCLASAPIPASELLHQAGVRVQQQEGRWRATRSVEGVSAAGAVVGTALLADQLLEGRLRGAEAVAALGRRAPDLERYRQEWDGRDSISDRQEFNRLFPQAGPKDRKRFICQCEDVTEKDIQQAVEEGFDTIETLKRYSTVTMGPCQGKMCHQASVEACSRATGLSLSTIGGTTARPPAVPVEMGVLAASRHHPVRRTPLHHWHEQAGAKWLDAGLWKRPESYGDPAAEARTVRTTAGLIDVGTLGKFEVSGPDAVRLLERVYLNRWEDLKPGRTRYGVMCNEDGIVFDDGVAARLGPDHFYLTATTGNADAVFQWLELWRTTWGLDVRVLDRTSAFAAMNLAGPKSREILARHTSIDLSPTGFPYLGYREGDVAGVPCRVLRIGFVGELGYEIHCPTAYAGQLWEVLYESGAGEGLRPFGVEAQRILRLEKGHLLIGQDTDALSTPLEAGLEWMVRFEKPHFLGRAPLLRLKEMGQRSRLVGFFMEDKGRVPPEGCQVVEQGRSVGRVTSSRFSPTLERSLGLAWVPATHANPGDRLIIRWEGADVPGMITATPFYDPEGKRLKS